MPDQILLYVSAALDLEPEREVLGRAVSEVPAGLRWRIVHSPRGDVPVDLEAVTEADVHLLLLGGDIRAPIGQEWMAARRAGRWPALYLKQGILRTPAAQNFVRYIAEQAPWQPFKDGAELRFQALRLLTGHIVQRAGYYALSAVELDRLRAWRAELEVSPTGEDLETRGGAGESSVILSPERYTPSEGVLIQRDEE